MLLRILLISIFCSCFNLPSNAVGRHATTHHTIIFDKKATPKKNGFFQKIKNNLLTKKIELLKAYYSTQKCDIIILKNGDQFDVKVVQINDDAVMYSHCDDVSGEATDQYSIQEILWIKYANGDRYELSENKLVKTNHTESITKGGLGMGFVLGFFLSIFGVLIVTIGIFGENRRNAILGAVIGMLSALLILASLASSI